MTREDIIRMAREAEDYADTIYEKGEYHPGKSRVEIWLEVRDQRFAALVATAKKQKVVEYMNSRAFATGHGDTIEDLLKEMEWQVAEREREACAKIVYGLCVSDNNAQEIVNAIRARGSK
jgi:hypothetical protein